MKRYTIFVCEFGAAEERALVEVDSNPHAVVKGLWRKRFGERSLPVYGAVRVVDNEAPTPPTE